MQELPVWLDEAQYEALKRYAENQGVCMEKALRDVFFKALGESYDSDPYGDTYAEYLDSSDDFISKSAIGF
ncbi:MAG: hypothetical protein J6328_00095 [Bacilli bacterium]|nr:hypothetical protein [Bacilli bacterium]